MRELRGELQHVQRPARVAVGQPRDRPQSGVGGAHAARTESPLGIGQGRLHDRHELVLAERAQHVHAAAREQCGIHLERRILGGGPDEDDRALLDVRQKGVLLRAVETVDLVDEQDRAHPPAAALDVRLGDDLPDLLYAGQHRREGDEPRAGDARHQRGERRLARAGRPPQDHRVQVAALERGAQHAARPEQVLLADDLIERARPHPVGERPRRCRTRGAGGLLEQLHGYVRGARSRNHAGSAARSSSRATGVTFQRARSASFAR